MNSVKSFSRTLLIALGALLFVACAKQPDKKSPLLNEITITELQEHFANGTVSVEQLVKFYLSRIDSLDKHGPQLNAVLWLNPDALSIARELDKEIKQGKLRGPMHGIPVLLKDNIKTSDRMPTTAGSRALESSYPHKDSYLAKQLRDAGAVILGKTNLSEWANFRSFSSSSGWSGIGGQTKNPYVISRNPCGSSSGSGVAVSANLCMVAIGTETNGSIVCPSGANGVVGIKPTVGLVSRTGIIPISFTQDIAGPMARTVSDVAICLTAITGTDPEDSKTLVQPKTRINYSDFLNKDGLKGKRIAVYTKPMGVHPLVDSLMKNAIETMSLHGAEIVAEFDVIYDSTALANSFEVMLYEFKSGLNQYLASLGENAPVRSLEEVIAYNKSDSIELKYFGQNILEMAQEKGDLTSETYLKALNTMLLSAQAEGLDRIMDSLNLDAIISPTGSPAWKTDLVNGDDFLLSSSSPAAMAGYPNITVPMGFAGHLPVGISIFGRAWSEPVLIEIAYAYEQATNHRKAPGFKTE